MVFTSDMVHILQGYPKKSPDNPTITLLAFYLQQPQGSSVNIVNKDTLTAIVVSDMSRIGASMGGTILSVQPLLISTDTTNDSDEESKPTLMVAILGATGAVVLPLVIIVAVVLACKRRER